MTAAELIKELSEIPPDARIRIFSAGRHDTEPTHLSKIGVRTYLLFRAYKEHK